jgi:hypothetical protein
MAKHSLEYRRSVYKNVPTRSISCGTLGNDFAQGRGRELIERPPL